MAPFQPEDKVLVNGKHAEVKTLKDIGGGHFEVGVVYTEDKRFDTVIYPFTEIQKIDSPIESAQKLKDNYWLYVVENALNESKKKIFAIRNPSERFKEVKIIRQETRYLISDWKTKI